VYYSRRKLKSSRKARIEIIPLIDVMFLLLCFFIYATMNMVVQQGIFVDLASSKTSKATPTDTQQLVLSVDKNGQYYANQRFISKKALSQRLKQIKNSYGTQVVVNADKEASHGQVVGLLDLVRQNGIEEAIFAVEPEGK